MKKLFLLVTVVLGLFLSGAGCAVVDMALWPIEKAEDAVGRVIFGPDMVKDGYTKNDLEKHVKDLLLENEDAQKEYIKSCDSDSDDAAIRWHKKWTCGWKGINSKEKCFESAAAEITRAGWCQGFDTLSNDIKGRGWRYNLEYIRNGDSLCKGKKPVHEFVADWERIHRGKCKDGTFDCVEGAFERCELRAVEVEWLDRQKIEEQYEEKKNLLCAGKLHPRPYKIWFEWAICKKYQEIGNSLNYTGGLGLLCPLASEVYLKAEKESCGR